MYLNFQTLLKGCRAGVFGRPISARRIFFTLLFLFMFLLNWVVIAIGRGLDHVFFPSFGKQKIEAPVFIVATPRSGTTFLHRLMSLDERFACFKLWQMAPARIEFHYVLYPDAVIDSAATMSRPKSPRLRLTTISATSAASTGSVAAVQIRGAQAA